MRSILLEYFLKNRRHYDVKTIIEKKKSHVFSQKKRPQTKDGFGTWYSEAKFDLPWISCYAFDRTTNKEPSVKASPRI